MIKQFVLNNERIPKEYRISKDRLESFILECCKQPEILNTHIFAALTALGIEYVKKDNKIEILKKCKKEYEKAIRVVNKEETEAELFDLSVPKTHSYIANGIISHNTINLPNNATEESIKKAIIFAHEIGCKGMTIYRDGSKIKQAYMLEKEEEIKSITEYKTLSRENKLNLDKVEEAIRYRIQDLEVDPEGKSKQYIYVTIKNGRPVEVITKFDAETKEKFISAMRDRSLISRLISVALRYGIPLEEIIIHCEKTSSNIYDFPYQLANILKGHLERIYKDKEKDMSEKTREILKPICPNCKNEAIYSEGCVSCLTCGYTKCG